MTSPEPQPSAGQTRIRAITRKAVEKGEAAIERAQAQQRRAPRWPDRGMPYLGILPGAWRDKGELDDTEHLPADCPVRPLGYDGENFFFVDTRGQIFNSQGKAMGPERMQLLFAGHEHFLYWAWPRFAKGGGVDSFRAEEARRDLFAACYERGPWNQTDQVRGRGAWLDDRGRLVLHCGEMLYIPEEEPARQGTGELGEHFYVRRPRAIEPWPHSVEAEDNPAVSIVAVMRSWNFVRRDTDVMLLLGWLAVALMGAALDWRPSVFIVGDAGTGKSELNKLLKSILGRFMVTTTNATEAGLYQLVGHDALPIGIDELEGEDGQAQAANIIKMARDAASGSVRIRGGANHEGVQFQARSVFMFSAINPPPIPPANMSRLAVLQMRPLTDVAADVPTLPEVETIGAKLLRRVADHWDDFPRLYEAYRTALRENGHDSRGQNTFGTFLAGAHLLLGDEGMEACQLPWESQYHWGRMLAAEAAPEVSGKVPNWSKCIDEILTSQVDAWNKGERRTIGQIVEDLLNDRNNVTENKANELLAIAGLKIVPKGRVGEGYGLAVPMSGKDVNKLMADSSWAGKGSNGSWSWALAQAPEHIVRKDMLAKSGKGDPTDTTNRVSIGGVQRRCLFVSLADLKVWQED